ncbi:endonuclease/exonuclease/phosphatase family protein [Streptomonospora nanhaiensis]|uniref:endonuclease/exonuclease/phosphatase family protein n=3 Tax=Streptomonospora nanhaiensis TaxID=1323731 RepID=UPI001C38D52A|nr:endonuclease/exonuclease/phosphatase family protein [Streptomonospora nanhaiensis]MBV2364137.1 endonuclease/exonuclease/phosphatase family protein [Streptomonospora nanhaiensis]
MDSTDPTTAPAPAPELLKVMSVNLQHGGVQAPTGRPQHRWPRIAADIGAAAPDILVLQECHGWRDHLHEQLYRALNDLDMRVAGRLVHGRAPFGGNLMLYRHQPGVLEQVGWSDAYEREHYNGLGIALLHVAGLPERLAVAGVHLTTVTPEAAATEAVWAADRVLRYSDHAVVIGDLNSHPAHGDDGGTAPDPRDITKDLDRTCRWHADGSPNRTVAERLVGSGLYDAAAHLARRTGLTTHYAATGRGGVRVDRAHLSRLLLDRLLDYHRIPTASDHHAIAITLDLAAPRAALPAAT